MIDLHLHTRFSFDSDELPEGYVEAARKLHIPAIGFSEHYDYDARLDGEDIALADVDAYYNNVIRLRRAYPDVVVLFGIEFGYRREALEEYSRLISQFPFDYVINSVHTIKGRGDCYHDGFFAGKPLRESYSDYLSAVLESVKSQFDYQVVGHIGYASRYRTGEGAKITYADFSDLFDRILTEIIQRDKCLEINTSSGTGGNEFLPDTDVIKRYLALGGKKLSFGSDAHGVASYLKKSEKLKAFLKSEGVESLYYYRGKESVPYKI